MLNVFRENLRSLRWVLYLVIGSFVVFFGVSWEESCRRGPAGGVWVARLGDRPVLPEEWRWQAQQIQRAFPLQQSTQVNDLALLSLVERLLVIEDARRLGMQITDDELDQYIQQLLIDPDTGAFIGRDRYQDAIRRGYGNSPHASIKNHETWVRDDRLVARWRTLVDDLAPGDDAFVQAVLERLTRRADVRYLTVSPGSIPGLAEPSDDEARAFAADRAGDLLRSGLVIAFDETILDPESLIVSDGQIDDYMRQNPEVYASPAQRQASVILLATPEDGTDRLEEARALADQLRQGELDFAETARARSDHEPTRDAGGDLGLRNRADLTDVHPVVTANLFGPVTAGSTLGPIPSIDGYWIIRVDQVIEPVLPEILPEAQANQIRVLLRSRLLDRLTDQRATDFRRSVSGLDEARERATAAGLPVREIGPVTEGEVPEDLAGGFQVVAELFDLEEAEVGRVVRLGQGYAVVARTALPASLPSPDDYLEAARRALSVERAAATLERLVGEARAGGGDIDAVAQVLGAEVQSTEGPVPHDLLEATLGAEARRAALGDAPPGSVAGPFEGPRGSVILQVVDRPASDPLAGADTAQVGFRTEAVLSQLIYLGILDDMRTRAAASGDLAVKAEASATGLPRRSVDAPSILAPFTFPSSQ